MRITITDIPTLKAEIDKAINNIITTRQKAIFDYYLKHRLKKGKRLGVFLWLIKRKEDENFTAFCFRNRSFTIGYAGALEDTPWGACIRKFNNELDTLTQLKESIDKVKAKTEIILDAEEIAALYKEYR